MLKLTRLPEDLGTGEEQDTPMECEPIDLYMFLLLLLKGKLFFLRKPRSREMVTMDRRWHRRVIPIF